MARPVTILDLQKMRDEGRPITMVTAYDYPTAKMADEAGVDLILVGDTLGMVILGYDSTLPVTVEDMIHHGRAAVRGAKRAHVVVDMPFGTYEESPQQAFRTAARLMAETEAGAVKLEGGETMAETIGFLTRRGIPVMVDAAQAMALGLLRGVKDTRVPLFMAVVAYWGVGLPVSFGLGFGAGMGGIGIWVGLAIGLAVAAGLLMWRFWARA